MNNSDRPSRSERAYTVQELAVILNVSPSTVLNLIHDDQLQAHKVRTVWRVFQSDLDDYLASIKK